MAMSDEKHPKVIGPALDEPRRLYWIDGKGNVRRSGEPRLSKKEKKRLKRMRHKR